ncbi:YbdD/YjiX family protein [uncultured Arthrobacter sp.]|uniref:YbdD/YjiX family protein n=1 Tax=uncultured Arthrobacter sp. TaxID=114050 RepID=UPI0026256810|nr:YbdD/YjiX family protein [uncultured Arthrobacter sp.]
MTVPEVLHRARATARELAWIFRGVMGENAYQTYLDHHERTHAEGRPMTEREFWRDKTDRQEANPEGRCCC